MKGFARSCIAWIPLALAIVGICGFVYAAVQQEYRKSLNDPQIQMAEDAASALGAGATPASVIPLGMTQPIDIATSLAPWIAVYNQSGVPIESDAVLNDAAPNVPHGVIEFVQSGSSSNGSGMIGEDRVTWQPDARVRQAIVVVRAGTYVVVAGRNMREVEDRESMLTEMVGLGMIMLLVVTLFATIVADRIVER